MEEENPIKEHVKTQLTGSAMKPMYFLPQTREDAGVEVAIIEGLSSEKHIGKVWLRVNGYDFNYVLNRWEQIRTPIMNGKGIGNLMLCLTALAKVDFSNYEEKELNRKVYYFFQENLPQFYIYATEFDLDESDFNIISSELFWFADAVVKSAKNAGNRNVVRGTLSESVYGKLMGNSDKDKQKKSAWGFLRNPFGGNKDG